MDMQAYLQGISHCSCGKSHPCPIDNVVIGKGAMDALPKLCENYRHILLVFDRNTYKAAGETVYHVLKNQVQDTMLYDTDAVVVPNESSIESLQAHITEKTDLLIGVGSGVINDLCKYCSFFANLPYMIVATAPSMDGFASVGAAMILKGMKATVNARPPKAIIGDVDVLKHAPFAMIQAGYGDIVGKYSCLNDWKLSHLVNGEYICDTVVNETYKMAEKTLHLSSALVNRDETAVGVLTEALVAVGILMAYVGNSRPASGSEHHLSHFFEITGLIFDKPYYPHGIDVLFSAWETAKIRETILKLDSPDGLVDTFDEKNYEKQIHRIYGSLAPEVLALQKKLGWYRQSRLPIYQEKWSEIRALLQSAPTPADMENAIRAIGLDIADFTSMYGKEKIADATRYAKDLKDRYTVLWLYDDLARAGGLC